MTKTSEASESPLYATCMTLASLCCLVPRWLDLLEAFLERCGMPSLPPLCLEQSFRKGPGVEGLKQPVNVHPVLPCLSLSHSVQEASQSGLWCERGTSHFSIETQKGTLSVASKIHSRSLNDDRTVFSCRRECCVLVPFLSFSGSKVSGLNFLKMLSLESFA